MNTFSDFVNQKNETKFKNENVKKNSSHSTEDLQDMIDKYSSLSKDNLMQEFIKLSLEKKKRGELGEREIVTLKNTIMPMLNEEQRKSLLELLEVVKNV